MTEPSLPKRGALTRWYLLTLVTLTGAVVLALEVLGTRVIGTHYGSSLYVWKALLSVTLICLAAGYAIGGRLADRIPAAWMLCVLVMVAGGTILLVPVLSAVLAPLDSLLGLRWGAIASALVIFVLPLTILAMAGPYVIRLRARSVAGVGRTSGVVYAVSTIGSVAGVLMVSLWMIPTLGTRTSLWVCATFLVGWGAVGLAVVTRGRGAAVLLLAVLPPAIAAARAPRLEGELVHTESAFGDLRVVQREVPGRGLYRMLLMNGIMQTGMPLDIDLVSRGSILLSDDYYLELLPYYHADLAAGRRGLLIGLAGGMFPRVMEFYDLDWTAVEIDVKVAELAKAYFGYRGEIHDPDGTTHEVDLSRFPDRESPVLVEHEAETGHTHAPEDPYRGRAIIQDGRRYLLKTTETFDFIVLDAYSSDVIPFHLITREFFTLVRNRLAADGILAINYIGPPGEDFVTDSLFRTLADVFGRDLVHAYRTRDDETAVQVITVLAFRQAMDLLPLWQEDAFDASVDRLSYDLSRRRLDTNRPGGTVITDDLNPIDLARAKAALDWRRQTLDLLREGRDSGE